MEGLICYPGANQNIPKVTLPKSQLPGNLVIGAPPVETPPRPLKRTRPICSLLGFALPGVPQCAAECFSMGIVHLHELLQRYPG